MYYLTNGGFIMYFILLMSVVGLSAVIERLIYLTKNEKNSRGYLTKELRDHLEKNEIKEAATILKNEKSSVNKVLREMLREAYTNPNSTREKIEEKGKEKAMMQIAKLEKNMWLVSLTAHLTPLLGLLGTVTGMIKAFQAVALHGTGNPAVLANGISEALFTTAGGLFVAIPALIFYNYLNKRNEKIISDIEISSTELINQIRG